MRMIILFFMVVIQLSCGLSTWETGGVTSQGLYVLSVSPEAESFLHSLSQIELIFSKPLAVETVSPNTLFVITRQDYEQHEQNWDDLHNEVKDGDVATIPYALEWLEGNQKVKLSLESALEEGVEYVVVVLPLVQAHDYMPLDQTAAGFVTKQFSSTFLLVSGTDSQTSVTDSSFTNAGSATYPDVASVIGSSPEESIPDETLPAFDWQRVLMTEVVPDPQQDHNESTPGNTLLFDEIAGTGTVSSSDEYIEIFNGSPDPVNVSGWSLNMVDGTDVNQTLNSSDWDKYFSAGGSLENFQAGELMVLGDPEGSVNNAVFLELINEVGEVLDSVDVKDANATGTSDESFYRGPDGEWLQGLASPGYFLD